MEKNNLKNIVIVVLVLLLGVSLVYIGYDKLMKDKDNNQVENNDNENNQNENNQNENNQVENNDNKSDYELKVLQRDISNCINCNTKECLEVIYTIKTQTKNTKLYVANDNFALYNDNGMKVYVRKSQEYININLEPDYNDYKLHISADNNKLIGIIANSHLGVDGNEKFKSVYYNIELAKKMYENKYFELFGYNDDFLAASNTSYPGNNNLLYVSKEEVLMDGYNLSLKKTKNSYYIIDDVFYTYNAIYTQNKKLIVSDIDYKNLLFVEENLYINSNNNILKYDVNGNLIETISYQNLQGFIHGEKSFIVYVEDNILKLKDVNTNEVIKIADWADKYELTNYSVYIKDENKVCIALKDKEKAKLDDSGTGFVGIEYYYNFTNKEITTKAINVGFTYQAWD